MRTFKLEYAKGTNPAAGRKEEMVTLLDMDDFKNKAEAGAFLTAHNEKLWERVKGILRELLTTEGTDLKEVSVKIMPRGE